MFKKKFKTVITNYGFVIIIEKKKEKSLRPGRCPSG